MVIPLHLGYGHPSMLWLVGTALLAFVIGLGINFYRSRTHEGVNLSSETSEKSE